MAAVAVPNTVVPGEGEAGVTLVVPAFHDQVAADLAARFLSAGDGEVHAPLLGQGGVDVAVFGAHLRGQPLNRQLQGLGARYLADVATAPRYRMHLVPGAVERPALVAVAPDDVAAPGTSVPGELWRLPRAAVVDLLLSIRSPLGLGDVELADGTTVLGFIAGTDRTHDDITHHGGWRAYRAATTAS
ncbi:allophanate hydrolase-related protein [Litorihabitans aurantiacus]